MIDIKEFILNVLLIIGFYGGLNVWIKVENEWARGAGMIISVSCFEALVGRA